MLFVKRMFTALLAAMALWVLAPAALAAEPEFDVLALPESRIVMQDAILGGVSLLSVEDGEWEEDWTCYKDQLTGDALAYYEIMESAFADDVFVSGDVQAYVNETLTTLPCWVERIGDFEFTYEGSAQEALNAWCENAMTAMRSACNAFVLDHPEYFWIRGSYATMFDGASATREKVKVSMSIGFVKQPNTDTEDEIHTLQAEINGVQLALAEATEGMNDYEKLKYMDNWLAEHNHYNVEAAADSSWIEEDETPWSIVGGLLDGYSPVCEGYAKAFQLFCHENDIPCLQVSGTASGGAHMWNYVKFGSRWYLCDPTWNDPLYAGGDGELYDEDESTQEYFLVAARADHVPDGTMLLPELSGEDFAFGCAEGHSYTAEVTEPTCTEQGYTTHTCTVCGDSYTDSFVEALGHSFTHYGEEEGLLVAHCDRGCGQTDEKLGTPSWRVENGELKGAEYTTGFVMVALYDEADRLIAVKFCEKGEEKTFGGETLFCYTAPQFTETELGRAKKILCFNFTAEHVPMRNVIPVE